MTTVPIILNPTAGGGRLLRRRGELDRAARIAGFELRWVPTEHPGHAELLARREADSAAPLVLAYGGDGTYNEVARGLIGSDSALGAVPGGTTSVLAYELGIPRPAPRALASLLAGDDRTMRPGRTDRGELFLLMLSSGPDTVVLSRLTPWLKRLGGRAGVALAAVAVLCERRPMPRLRCSCNGRSLSGGWVIVGRSRCYAGPFHATPGAHAFGEALEVVVHERIGRRFATEFAAALVFGRHVRRRDVSRFLAVQLRLETEKEARSTAYQVDGDAVATLPVEIGLAEDALRVRVPG